MRQEYVLKEASEDYAFSGNVDLIFVGRSSSRDAEE